MLGNQAVRAAQQLLWVPLFLAAFGEAGYGEWLTILGLAGYALMADLGVQIYWLNLLTGAYVRGDLQTYRRFFRAGLFLLACVGAVVVLVALLFVGFDGPHRVLRIVTIPNTIASIIFMILVGSSLLFVLAAMLRGTFRTAGENPRVVAFELSKESMLLIAVAAGLLLRASPLGIAAVYAAVALAMVGWVLPTVRQRFRHLVDLRIHRADRASVFSLVGGGSIMLLGACANLLLAQGTLIVTNWAMGAVVVTLVATTRTLANLVRQAAGAVYLAALPEFSRLEAASDKPAMEQLLRRTVSLVLVMSGAALIGLVGLGPWLFDTWTGRRFPEAAPLIYLFAASVVVDALRMPLHDFLLGCNKIGWAAAADIVYAVCSLGVMWLLFYPLGAWAVPAATIGCGILLHLPAVVAASSRILGRPFMLRLLVRMSLGVLVAAAALLPLVLAISAGIKLPATALVTLGSMALFAALFWLLVLDPSDAAMLRVRLARLLARHRA